MFPPHFQDSNSGHLPTDRHVARCGFSLVELLVVMGIIVLLAVVGSAALRGGSKSTAVGAALDQAAAIVEQAKLEAISMGLGAKLVMDNDPASKERLRRLAVFTGNYDAINDRQDGWKLAGRAHILPEGVHFLSGYSEGWATGQRFDLRNANPQDGASGGACLVLEFDGEGRLISNTAARKVWRQRPHLQTIFWPGGRASSFASMGCRRAFKLPIKCLPRTNHETIP